MMGFASPEDPQRAVRKLSEVPLLGRLVFIREVRCWVVYRAYLHVDSIFNGFEWYGRTPAVREVFLALGAFRGGLHGFGGGCSLRGGLRGG